MADSTRERMIAGTTALLAQAGVSEASFRNVVAMTGAPRGSIYHHFPRGKDQLLSEAVRSVGGRLLTALRSEQVDTPAEGVLLFAGLFRRMFVDSTALHSTANDRTAVPGCAVAAVAVDTPASSPPADAAAEVFRTWIRELRSMLERTGVPPAEAEAYATTTVAAVEGAMVLSRATGDLALFDVVVEQLVRRAP